MNVKTKKTFSIILWVLIFALTFFAGFEVQFLVNKSASKKLNEILYYINNHAIYLENEITIDDLAKLGVKGVLKDDNYANYYDEESWGIEKEESAGNYLGFGFYFVKNTNVVQSVVLNSPAEINGISSGESIISITYKEEKTLVSDFSDIEKALKNVSANQLVTFELKKENDQVYSLALEKQEYKAVYFSYVDNQKELKIRTDENGDYYLKEYVQNKNTNLNDNTAYLYFSEFNGSAKEQLLYFLDYMKANKKTNLILDLRNNGGGSVQILKEIAQTLLPTSVKKGSVLAVAKLKNDSKNFTTDKNGANDFIKKIVVLANENTASASESLIGALSYYSNTDYDFTNVVCEYNESRKNYSSFGKGIMQTTYSLTSGGAVKFTTAKLYWPDNTTCIHGVGIKPNVAQNGVNKGMALTRALEIFN